MSVKSKEINRTIYMLKALACFGVVLIHCPFPSILGTLAKGPISCAVPLFFMISGYYSYFDNENCDMRISNRAKYIGKILFFTEVGYFVWHCVKASINAGAIGTIEWMRSAFSIENIVRFICFQTPFIGDVSWYLVVLLLCYLVARVLYKYKFWNRVYWMIPILLICNILIGEIVPTIQRTKTSWWYCSNFWLIGFPIFTAGHWLHKQEKILEKYINDKMLFTLIIISIGLSVMEVVIAGGRPYYLGNFITVPCLMLFAIRYSDFQREKKWARLLEEIGKKYSLYVYLLHPIIRDILNMVAVANNITIGSVVWILLLPIMTAIISLMIAVMIYKIISFYRENNAIVR